MEIPHEEALDRPGLGLACATGALAQAWPAKPVTLLVPFPPGGSTDMIARTLAPKLQEKLGGTFVVENKAGATGTVGAGAGQARRARRLHDLGLVAGPVRDRAAPHQGRAL
jgi:tripartite-type tricarboxylate transporter receptor subunit TctC